MKSFLFRPRKHIASAADLKWLFELNDHYTAQCSGRVKKLYIIRIYFPFANHKVLVCNKNQISIQYENRWLKFNRLDCINEWVANDISLVSQAHFGRFNH